jgi:hypothetical protein
MRRMTWLAFTIVILLALTGLIGFLSARQHRPDHDRVGDDKPTLPPASMNQKAKVLSDLDIGGSGCGNVLIKCSGVLLAEYKVGFEMIGAIRFNDVVSYRFRKEYFSSGYCPGSYDSLVEVLDSDWLPELKKIQPKGFKDMDEKRHYAVFFSSNGYLEVVAAEAIVLPVVVGTLQDVYKRSSDSEAPVHVHGVWKPVNPNNQAGGDEGVP